MKKTLIALALSTVPLAAVADVTLYGSIKGGLEYTKVKGVDNTVTNINDWGSYIGFKGEEDLGNGLKAIWQIEQSVSLDSNSRKNTRWASKESFIGLAGSFGTLRAGYLADSFKSGLKKLDPWEGNGVRTLDSFSRYGDRYTAVRYDSPDWSGFSFNVLYSPEDNNRFDQARRERGDVIDGLLRESNDGFEALAPVVNVVTKYQDILSVGLGYENYNWFVNYAYKNVRNMGDDGRNGEVHGIDVGYNNDVIFAGVGYRNSRNFISPGSKIDDIRDSQWETNEAAVTFAYTVGNIVPRISLAYGEEKERHVENAIKNKYTQVIVGVDYNLSKRTAVLASLGYWTNKPKSWKEHKESFKKKSKRKHTQEREEAYSFGLGLRHQF